VAAAPPRAQPEGVGPIVERSIAVELGCGVPNGERTPPRKENGCVQMESAHRHERKLCRVYTGISKGGEMVRTRGNVVSRVEKAEGCYRSLSMLVQVGRKAKKLFVEEDLSMWPPGDRLSGPRVV
jgi:hypothetical protein